MTQENLSIRQFESYAYKGSEFHGESNTAEISIEQISPKETAITITISAYQKRFGPEMERILRTGAGILSSCFAETEIIAHELSFKGGVPQVEKLEEPLYYQDLYFENSIPLSADGGVFHLKINTLLEEGTAIQVLRESFQSVCKLICSQPLQIESVMRQTIVEGIDNVYADALAKVI